MCVTLRWWISCTCENKSANAIQTRSYFVFFSCFSHVTVVFHFSSAFVYLCLWYDLWFKLLSSLLSLKLPFTCLGPLWCAWNPGEEPRHVQRRHLVHSQRQQVGRCFPPCAEHTPVWLVSYSSGYNRMSCLQARLHLRPLRARWQQKRRRDPKDGHGPTQANRQLSVQGETDVSKYQLRAHACVIVSSHWQWVNCLPCAAAYSDHLTLNIALVFLVW